MPDGLATRAVFLILAVAVLATACEPSNKAEPPPTSAGPAASTSAAPAPDPGFYLNIIWHQHQPFYPKDANGIYTRPWVRVHATKDYYDMAALVAEYPEIRVTFNLTPVLLLQLEDLANGAKDVYWQLSEVPAPELDEEQSRFILERFFDVNPRIVARFPRYQELADSRAQLGIEGALGSWSDQDFRDLQLLFNLAWTDLDFLAQEPLAALVAAGGDFSEDDKAVLFSEHRRIIEETIPLYSRLWRQGSIELTTTPIAHPILPLLADTNLAAVGDPAAVLPRNRFQEIPDADEQVIRGLEVAGRLLGATPTGMWPGEGAVSQLVMSLFSKNGVKWVASGEEVLGKTLGIGSFSRDAADLITQPELLYRPYSAQLRRNDPVAMFFRDGHLSDLIGFEYSGISGAAAADDLMRRLQAIRDALDSLGMIGGEHPPVVSVILDGENAWEHYHNDGKDFLRALYQRLSQADWVATTTPSEYLERFPESEPLGEVWPGAWFQPNFATWIGEPEEATAWDYLYETRQDLRRLSGDVSPERYSAAYEKMLFAEGSDWFWWYGSDQASGDDGYFDRAFRELLGQVYDELGVDRPVFVSVPIIPETPLSPTRGLSDALTPVLGDAATWTNAGLYDLEGTGPEAVLWAFDQGTLFLRVEGAADPVVVYLGLPEGERSALGLDGTPLGFGTTHTLVVEGCAVAINDQPATLECSRADGGLDLAVPLQLLGSVESGDRILAKLDTDVGRFPAGGPMAFQVPDISSVEVFLDVEDPVGDDHGPGTYTYPLDPVFTPGSYDIQRFQVGIDGENAVFTFEIVAPIQNPWGSPRNLSIQAFDIYIDTDPLQGTGSRMLIPGRNASLPAGSGWEYAITLEGWEPAIYTFRPEGTLEETRPSFDILVFADKGKVVAKVPLILLGDRDPTGWAFGAALMSQEGFPSAGVRRIRDVERAAAQWRLGGGPADINHTRIIDAVTPVEGEQERFLSAYPPVPSGDVSRLHADDFAVLPLVGPS